ncbi:MAG TPA: type II toxin-antitoxin system VapC family toxin [Rhizomicrobium sp.]
MLDASALLAHLQGEPGGDKVPLTVGDAAMSAVNYAETVSVLTRKGADAASVRAKLSTVLLDIVDFDYETAEAAGLMVAMTRPFGLSLGDRACIAAAAREGVPVLTAERSWSNLNPGVPIQLIR